MWVYIKNKANKSRYIEELVKQDLQMQQTKPIVKAVIDELLKNEYFFKELSERLKLPQNTASIPSKLSPTLSTTPEQPFTPRPPDPKTGYSCCQKEKPCKHWTWEGNESAYINSLTGARREVLV